MIMVLCLPFWTALIPIQIQVLLETEKCWIMIVQTFPAVGHFDYTHFGLGHQLMMFVPLYLLLSIAADHLMMLYFLKRNINSFIVTADHSLHPLFLLYYSVRENTNC